MAKRDMTLEVMEFLNTLFKHKEAGLECVHLFSNLKQSLDKGPLKLQSVEVEEFGVRVINSVELPEELRIRLLECADQYYHEMLDKFNGITVDGDVVPEEEEDNWLL